MKTTTRNLRIYQNQLSYLLPRPKLSHDQTGLLFFATKSFREVGKLARVILAEQFPECTPRKKYTFAMETILFNIVCSALYKEIHGLDIPAAISTRNGSTFSSILGYRNVQKVISFFEESGYITVTAGYRSEGYSSGIPTKLQATDKFQALLQEYTLTPVKSEGELVSVKEGTLTETDEVVYTRKVLKECNALIKGASLSIDRIVDAENQVDILLSKKGASSDKRVLDMPLVSDFCTYQRTFKWDQQTGGRLYSGIQSIPREERFSLKIDGEETCEYDFSCMHARMLWSQLGLEAPADCYAIEGVDRDVIKTLLLVSLNASSRRKALRVTREMCTEDGHDLSKVKLGKVMDQLLKLHAPIADKFFTGAWKELQYLESKIMLATMEHFQKKGVVCLGVHDSAIVPAQYGKELKTVLEDNYKLIMGVEHTAPVDRKDREGDPDVREREENEEVESYPRTFGYFGSAGCQYSGSYSEREPSSSRRRIPEGRVGILECRFGEQVG